MNFTLIPDPLDPRDHIFEWDATAIVPSSRDLRDYTGMAEDQLARASCTANATVSACEMFLIANGELVDTPDTDAKDLSRLFNYYCSRHNIGGRFDDNDIGSTARESLRSARNQGLCYEVTWPYIPEKWNATPTDVAYMEAILKTIGEYSRIMVTEPGTFRDMNPIGQIKYALAQGYPVLIGMTVGERLMTLTPGQTYSYVHPITNPSIGNHEMLIVGYDGDDLIIENSWGSDWCDKGYFRCRAAVAMNNVIDLWVVKGFAGYETVGKNLIVTDEVMKAYREMLHREPDPAGYVYWKQANLSVHDLRSNFARSQEFIQTHQMVESLYRDILLREPDVGGLAAWKASGLTVAQMVDGFVGSVEFKAKFA